MATWTQRGNIRGPVGPEGPQGAQGLQGIQGPTGVDGAGIAIAGSVPTYADLPTTLTDSQADRGQGYLVESDGRLYIWAGTAFPSEGSGVEFRGPQGPAGPQGEVGPTGAQGSQGEVGSMGPSGPQGTAGPQGVQGETGVSGAQGDPGIRGSRWFDDAGVPSSVPGSVEGDYYLDRATGTYYELIP